MQFLTKCGSWSLQRGPPYALQPAYLCGLFVRPLPHCCRRLKTINKQPQLHTSIRQLQSATDSWTEADSYRQLLTATHLCNCFPSPLSVKLSLYPHFQNSTELVLFSSASRVIWPPSPFPSAHLCIGCTWPTQYQALLVPQLPTSSSTGAILPSKQGNLPRRCESFLRGQLRSSNRPCALGSLVLLRLRNINEPSQGMVTILPCSDRKRAAKIV